MSLAWILGKFTRTWPMKCDLRKGNNTLGGELSVVLVTRHRTTTCGKSLERFEPGFYSDGDTVYVDMGEFLATYGVCDLPEIRAVLWSDLREIFSGVPVQELPAKTSVFPPRRRTALA
jgi:hypothetical protein